MISQKRNFVCYYCGKKINLKELEQVDFELGHIESEQRELIMDNLPSVKKPAKIPYIHKLKKEYDILNICTNCYSKAYKKYLGNN